MVTPSAKSRAVAEQILRDHEDFCAGHVQVDTPWCSCAPNGTPLCNACSKLADAIALAIDAAIQKEGEHEYQ